MFLDALSEQLSCIHLSMLSFVYPKYFAVCLYFCIKLFVLITGWIWNAWFFWWKWTTPFPYITWSTVQKFRILLHWTFHWSQQRSTRGKMSVTTEYDNISVILIVSSDHTLYRVQNAEQLFITILCLDGCHQRLHL